MNTLAETIRLLMDRRGLTGVKLSEAIGLSPTSVSKIITGQSKPRQVTFSRLMKCLCTNAEEEQLMVSAFESLSEEMRLSPEKAERPAPVDEVERVTRYMEVKSMSIAFKQDVEAVLRDSGVSYEKDFRTDPYICDFLLSLDGRRIAMDCKYNVNRDWDRTVTTVLLLREGLPCHDVIIVVPYENELARSTGRDLRDSNGKVVALEKLKEIADFRNL